MAACEGIHISLVFQHYEGAFNGRIFSPDVPPPVYFQNAPVCRNFSEFVPDTITMRLKEGSMLLLGKIGETSPPRVLIALSVEQVKPRLILFMRAVNLFVVTLPFL